MRTASYAQQGWDFAAEIMGADYGAQGGGAYVDAVEEAINDALREAGLETGGHYDYLNEDGAEVTTE